MTISFREKTNYPKIYDVYWGCFEFNPEKDNDMFQIFENRNKFAEKYKLKKSLDKSKSNIYELLIYEFNKNSIKNEILNYDKNFKFLTNTQIKNNLLHTTRTLSTSRYADHVEVYETTDNKIIILSNPYTKKDEDYNEFLKESGFINLDELLYSNNAVSFFKIYEKSELKQTKEKIKDLIKQLRTI